jgi:hypothetical protein
MQTIKLSESSAREIYPGASNEWKKLLDDSFGKNFFNQKITDRVRTFQDACVALGIKGPDFTVDNINGIEKDFVSIEAYTKLIIITRALNEGWKPNWKDSNEGKYYPWFDLSSGSGLSYDDYDLLDFGFVLSALAFASNQGTG